MIKEYISIEGLKVRVTETTKPHSMTHIKNCSWPVFCKRCGLVALKNKVSQKALQRGCIEYHETVIGKV